MRSKKEKSRARDPKGFTLIEVLISMVITVIVMGAVFGLLTRGQRSFQREPQVADLQQNARVVLDMVSKDVYQAGAGLPPEFPSITPKSVDPSVGDQGVGVPDIIEVVGTVTSPDIMNSDPETLITFDGMVATLDHAPTPLMVGDMVVIYNNDPLNAEWVMRWVTGVNQTPPNAMVTVGPTSGGGINIPPAYSRNVTPFPWAGGFIIKVSTVRYFAQPQGDDLVMMRQVNFDVANRMPVGMIEDFQVVYMVGNRPALEQLDPPHPHPALGANINTIDIISGVRVTVAARSQDQNLEGSTVGPSGNYIRKTFSSNITPRNISGALAARNLGWQ
jgi:prepilin-type N-terminal cleavage/methylation domain-containing protein